MRKSPMSRAKASISKATPGCSLRMSDKAAHAEKAAKNFQKSAVSGNYGYN
jgi:hypothetical protein